MFCPRWIFVLPQGCDRFVVINHVARAYFLQVTKIFVIFLWRPCSKICVERMEEVRFPLIAELIWWFALITSLLCSAKICKSLNLIQEKSVSRAHLLSSDTFQHQMGPLLRPRFSDCLHRTSKPLYFTSSVERDEPLNWVLILAAFTPRESYLPKSL